MAQMKLTTTDDVLQDEADFVSNVSRFYNQQDLSDITIKVGEHKFYGHRFVLAKSSDVFKMMLYDQKWSISDNCLELEESSECVAVFDKFLMFLYKARVTVNDSSCIGLLCLADKYNVGSLRRLCITYMTSVVRYHIKHVFSWYAWAKMLNIDNLKTECMKRIAWNFAGNAFTEGEWCGIDVNTLTEILQSEDLYVKSEHDLFEALSEWLLHSDHVDDLKENCAQVLPYVRFPIMNAHDFVAIEQSELMMRDESRDVLSSLLAQAYRFQCLSTVDGASHVFNIKDTVFLSRGSICEETQISNLMMTMTSQTSIKFDINGGAIGGEDFRALWKLLYRIVDNNCILLIKCVNYKSIPSDIGIQVNALLTDEEGVIMDVQKSFEPLTSTKCHEALHIKLSDYKDASLLMIHIKYCYVS